MKPQTVATTRPIAKAATMGTPLPALYDTPMITEDRAMVPATEMSISPMSIIIAIGKTMKDLSRKDISASQMPPKLR